ncbi:hypothetical protein, partial [Rikenella microfusus]
RPALPGVAFSPAGEVFAGTVASASGGDIRPSCGAFVGPFAGWNAPSGAVSGVKAASPSNGTSDAAPAASNPFLIKSLRFIHGRF